MKKLLIIFVLFCYFGFNSNAQITMAEKYGLRVVMYLEDIWESKNRNTGDFYPYISFRFVVYGANNQFNSIFVKLKLLDNIYEFSTLTTTDDIDEDHYALVKKFNKHSNSNTFEIKNQRIGRHLLSRELLKLPCNTTKINEEKLRECLKIEIIDIN